MVEAALPLPFSERLAKDKKSFDYQFRTRRFISLENGGKLEYVDICPKELTSEVPVYLAPGWTEEIESLKQPLQTLFDQGRRVISLTHTRRGRERFLQNDYHKAEERKAYAHLTIIDDIDADQVDVVAHSEGAINTIIAATRHPEKFRNFVLFAPAGITHKETTFGLIKKGAKHVLQNRWEMFTHPTNAVQIARGEQKSLQYIIKNPYMAGNEIHAIAGTHHLQESLRTLHDKGKGIIVIQGIDDYLFSMPDIQENIIFAGGKREAQTKQKGFVDGFYSISGTHNLHVRPDRTIAVVGHALDQLDKLSKKKKTEFIPSQRQNEATS